MAAMKWMKWIGRSPVERAAAATQTIRINSGTPQFTRLRAGPSRVGLKAWPVLRIVAAAASPKLSYPTTKSTKHTELGDPQISADSDL